MNINQTIATAQAEGVICAIVDARHAFNTELAIAEGVNLADLLVSQPDNLDQALEIVDTLLRTGAIGFVVVDIPELRSITRLRQLQDTAARTQTVALFAI